MFLKMEQYDSLRMEFYIVIALIFQNGHLIEWYQNGRLHRNGDYPAQVDGNGSHIAFYKNGNCHREGDLPAVIIYPYDKTNDFEPVRFCWFKDGLLHRENGPAIEGRLHNDPSKTWSRAWAQNGEITKIKCNHTGEYRKFNGKCEHCDMLFCVTRLQSR